MGMGMKTKAPNRGPETCVETEGWVHKRIERSWHWPVSQYFDTWAKYQDRPDARGIDIIRDLCDKGFIGGKLM